MWKGVCVGEGGWSGERGERRGKGGGGASASVYMCVRVSVCEHM